LIGRRTVIWLGLAQLISWGTTYYLVGGFGDAIAAELHWTRDVVYGGFSVGLFAMGVVSPLTGRLIDRHGGRPVMIAGSLCNAAGCVAIAMCHDVVLYFAAWIVLGVAMRLTLYEAAFAALARIAGAGARNAMAQITLFGGLSSTVFWPLGHAIAARAGWRGAVFAYAGFALATVLLHRTIPADRHDDAAVSASATPAPRPLAVTRADVIIASTLYAAISVLASFLNAGMSSQMISILTGLGVVATTAVWIATLRGIGQVVGRLSEVLFGRHVDPLTLNLATSVVMPVCFIIGLFGGRSAIAALGFALLYGMSNGVLTITRGTVPLLLFDPRVYGSFVGRLLVPSFVLSAAAPVLYAFVLRHFGEVGELVLSIIAGGLTLISAALLWLRFGRKRHA
jgi:predicted MFS family arabinose efflux permease